MFSELTSDLRHRLRAIFRRRDMERDLDDELRFHLACETEKLVRAGQTPAEAERLARAAFGGVERFKEESRATRGVTALEVVAQDTRQAWRGVRRRPGFTAAVVLTLGLGIGVNAAMFGVIDRMMFRPPAFLREPATVHRVYLTRTLDGQTSTDLTVEYTRYLDLARWSHAFAEVAVFSARPLAVGTGAESREMLVGTVSASYFRLFDARPALGRFFSAQEDTTPAGAPVVVLSYPFWQSAYGARDVIGEQLRVGTLLCTIVGVAPEGFEGVRDGEQAVLWIPVTTFAASRDPSDPTNYFLAYNWGWLHMLARRKPGVSMDAASRDLGGAYRRSWEAERTLSPNLPSLETARPTAAVGPVLLGRGDQAGREADIALWVSGVAFIVFLIACANVANLVLARALRRRREIAVRLALGVGRGRLAAHLFTESLLLALLGGVAGLVAAQLGGAALRTLLPPTVGAFDAWRDARTVAFAAIVAVVAGVLTGLLPMLRVGKGVVTEHLKSGPREGTHQRSRARTALVVAQGALSVLLLVGGGLFVRSLHNVRAVRLGYDVDPILFVAPNMRGVQLDADRQRALGRELLEAAKRISGVEGATTALTVPFYGYESRGLYVDGVESVRRQGQFLIQAATPEYFATLGTRILRGRGFTAADAENAPRVTVVSEDMARALWRDVDPIGQCLRIDDPKAPCTTVVGVAESARLRSLTEPGDGLQYYVPLAQMPTLGVSGYFVRTRGHASVAAEAVRRQLQQLMPGEAFVTAVPMEAIIGPVHRSWRAAATLFLAFGALALTLAAVGLYGVIAYDVTQRTQELGVRVALGARRTHVLSLIVGEAVRFAVAGIVIGAALALAAGRWVAPLLYDVSPRDPATFATVAATLFTVAVLASALPALRALRLDPNIALRAE